jgi:hypothetical protein
LPLGSEFEGSGGTIQGPSETTDFGICEFAVTGLYGFGQRRQNERLVCWSGRVDEMLEPGPATKTLGIEKGALNFHEPFVDALGASPVAAVHRLAR